MINADAKVAGDKVFALLRNWPVAYRLKDITRLDGGTSVSVAFDTDEDAEEFKAAMQALQDTQEE